jgi:hypothetical protein
MKPSSLSRFFSELIVKTQKLVIYVCLAAILLFQILAVVIKPLHSFMIGEGVSIVIFALLLLIFRFVDYKFKTIEKGIRLIRTDMPNYYPEFGDAINNLFLKRDTVDTMDIFAHTSEKFYAFIRDRKMKINKVRVLLRSPDASYPFSFPVNKEEQEFTRQKIHLLKKDWENLSQEGYINQLSVKAYNFEPSFFGITIDERKALIGFFLPRKDRTGVKALTCYIISDTTEYERAMLTDFKRWFDTIFNSFSSKM